VSGAYWAVMAMDLMGESHQMERDKIVDWLLQCQHNNGMSFKHQNFPEQMS
jgi:prenyltransferase beta subunit